MVAWSRKAWQSFSTSRPLVLVIFVMSMLLGYLATVAIETPVLLLGLSPRYGWRDRLAAGVGLTGFSYPFVALVFPALLGPDASRTLYLCGAESFAPLTECLFFRWIFPSASGRDMAVIVLANLVSFAVGELGLSRLVG